MAWRSPLISRNKTKERAPNSERAIQTRRARPGRPAGGLPSVVDAPRPAPLRPAEPLLPACPTKVAFIDILCVGEFLSAPPAAPARAPAATCYLLSVSPLSPLSRGRRFNEGHEGHEVDKKLLREAEPF